jgi:hypothetical protein
MQNITAKCNGTNEPDAEAVNLQRPAAYWADLLDHAAKKVGIEIEPGRYAPAHVRDMAKGARIYPRSIASAVRALYLKDISRQEARNA